MIFCIFVEKIHLLEYMKIEKKTVKAALLKGERVMLECKLAKAEVPKSVWETYSAFANTIGGLILLGVEEHKKETDPAKRFEIKGVDNCQKIVTDFWNTVNSEKVNENILVDSDVETVNMDGAQIVCIHVPQADWRAKPIYLNGNVYKGTYKRNNEGDYHCTEAQVKAMIRDANDEGNDSLLMRHYGMEDIDEESLRQYRTEFRTANQDHIWNKYDDKKFLTSFGAYSIDKETGEEGLTLAGLLMFGTGLAVRERLSNFRMDYVDMSHLVGDERYHDRLTYDGRWENNVYQFLNRVLPKFTSDLPRPFRMEGLKRIDDTPQHKAVREAFTNAIIHADVFLPGGVLRIDKYDDRLVLRNPGTLRLPIEKIYDGGTSRARNPRVQNMLRMIGYGENLGSGFPLILSAWKEAGWGNPVLENKIELDEVELALPVPSNKLELSKGVLKGLSERQKNIVWRLIETGQKMTLDNILKDALEDVLKEVPQDVLENALENTLETSASLSAIFKVNERTIRRDLSALRAKGIVCHIGPDKGGRWVVFIRQANE